MIKSIAFLHVTKKCEHIINLYDGIDLPPGEYDLIVNLIDKHGLNNAELNADAGRSEYRGTLRRKTDL